MAAAIMSTKLRDTKSNAIQDPQTNNTCCKSLR